MTGAFFTVRQHHLYGGRGAQIMTVIFFFTDLKLLFIDVYLSVFLINLLTSTVELFFLFTYASPVLGGSHYFAKSKVVVAAVLL